MCVYVIVYTYEGLRFRSRVKRLPHPRCGFSAIAIAATPARCLALLPAAPAPLRRLRHLAGYLGQGRGGALAESDSNLR